MKSLIPTLLIVLVCLGASAADTLEQLVFEPKWLDRDMTNFPADQASLGFKWDVDKKEPEKKESASSSKAGSILGQKVPTITVHCNQSRLLGMEVIMYRTPSKGGGLDEAGYKALFQTISEELDKKLKVKGESLKYFQGEATRWYVGDSMYDLRGWAIPVEYKEKGKTTKYTSYSLWLSVRPALESFVFSPRLWELSGSRFAEQNSMMGFEWTSAAKDSARSAWPGKFLNINVPEAIVRVSGDKVTAVGISLFNKGDSGARKYQSSQAFADFVQEVRETMDKKMGAKAAPRPSDSSNVARAEGVVWKGKEANYLLEWSETRANSSRKIPYQAEFLRLVVTPAAASSSSSVGNVAGKWKGTDHIKTESNGDKYIFDVPMVDQGQKGYCAVAVAERVLRYYGMDVDQHEVAKLAGSSSASGTSIDELRTALKSIASKLKLRSKTIMEPDERFTRDLFNDYNKTAKRLKKDQLSQDTYWVNTLDKDVLKESRSKDKSGLNRLEKNVELYVDQGKPILWCVYIGWATEPKILPQMRGGHMRLIIGYNKKEREIIFTDTWGAGHEMKKMKLEDAWAMTLGFSIMEPTI